MAAVVGSCKAIKVFFIIEIATFTYNEIKRTTMTSVKADLAIDVSTCETYDENKVICNLDADQLVLIRNPMRVENNALVNVGKIGAIKALWNEVAVNFIPTVMFEQRALYSEKLFVIVEQADVNT